MTDAPAKTPLSPEAQAQLAELTLELAHNPKTRKKYVKLVQELDPSKRFPDIEAEDIREEMQKEFEKRDRQREAERVTERLAAQRQSLIDSGRFTEETVGKMEKEVMEKHGISDYDVAATYYGATTRAATPTPEIQSHIWEMPKIETKDFGRLRQIRQQRIRQAVDEVIRKRA